MSAALSDNQALNQLLILVRRMEKLARKAYDSVSGASYVVSSTAPHTRTANANAVAAVITNLGSVTARIYEGGKLVKLLPANETWVSPLAGSAAIVVDTAGSATTVSLATYILNPEP